mmetsp:Transcript_25157/g.25358  ORF Transcript_25157/g.25358 Transcript_25157/m.25358 type:complete len:296 (+) Transcript_25157:274-1161(+)
MASNQSLSRINDYDDEEPGVTRKISIHSHRKKQAANDAQLLMNRIALLQKEEERSIKKIEQTKERALEILALRDENEKRLQTLIDANDYTKRVQKQRHQRNLEIEQESRKVKMTNAEEILQKKREAAQRIQRQKQAMRMESLTQERIEHEKKQKQRELIRKQEEEIRQRKEMEKKEHEKRVHESFVAKCKQEEAEADRAEKLVRALEKKEREWIEKLRTVQVAQETAFERLESALIVDSISSPLSREGTKMSGGGSVGSGTSSEGLLTLSSRSGGGEGGKSGQSSARSKSASRIR